MKIALLLLLLFWLTDALAQWEIIAPSPITEFLTSPALINQEKGFVSAGDGVLYKTSDGFKHSKKIVTGAGGRIYRSQFTDELNGYIIMAAFPFLGYGEEMLKTTDGGSSWYKLDDPLLYRPMGISFINKDTGWVSTWDKVLFTSDGGMRWEVRWGSYMIVKFLDKFNGWGIAGNAYRTTDGGNTWQSLNFPGIMQEIVIQNNLRIMLVGENANNIILSITSDGGINWAHINTLLSDVGSSTFWEDSTIIFSSGSYARRSDDLGSTWTFIKPAPPFSYGNVDNYCFNEKYYFFGSGGLITCSTDQGITWNNLGSEHGGGRIFFIDDLHGYTAPWYLTTDGGYKWELKEELIPDYYGGYDFYLFTPLRGIFAYGNRFFITTDGGISWDTLLIAEEYLTGFNFIDSLYGYAIMLNSIGNEEYVIGFRKTTDGGITWSSFKAVQRDIDIQFVSRDLGFARTTEGTDGARTTDGGMFWYRNDFGKCEYISMIDSLTGFGTRYSGSEENYLLLKTMDRGDTYYIINEDIPVRYIYFIDQLTGWGTYNGKIYKTSDGGINWELEFQGKSISQFYVHKPDQLFAVGPFGTLLKRSGPLSSTELSVPDIPFEFSLYQNYPNPFNNQTIISYSIPVEEYVTLRIYDVLGNEVAELAKGEYSAGRYDIRFNASELASGIYFYRLSAGDYTAVKKLQLLK